MDNNEKELLVEYIMNGKVVGIGHSIQTESSITAEPTETYEFTGDKFTFEKFWDYNEQGMLMPHDGFGNVVVYDEDIKGFKILGSDLDPFEGMEVATLAGREGYKWENLYVDWFNK